MELEPSVETWLRRRSEVMVDKLQAVRRENTRERIGRADPAQMEQVERLLVFLLGLGEPAAA